MRFSRCYTKLQDRLFTTIRSHSFYNEGDVVECQTPMGTLKARVLLKFSIPFKDLPEDLLRYDTDSPELSAAEIRDEIRSLYRANAPADDSDMTRSVPAAMATTLVNTAPCKVTTPLAGDEPGRPVDSP